MKKINTLFVAALLLFFVGCGNKNVKQDQQDNPDVPVVEQNSAGGVVDKQVSDQESGNDEHIEVAKEKTGGVKDASMYEPDEVYGHKGDGINKNMNPDNLNMAFEVEEEKSHIQYIPLLNEDDKDGYFVQILVSAYKLPRTHFEKSFNDSQRIYVAQVGDHYRYAIAKLSTKQEALEKMQELQNTYTLKRAKVTRFID